ncbi:MAG: PilZ domain-containing protein [Planctomycetota bacterium]
MASADRRKQRRRRTRMPGILHLSHWSGEVAMRDVSPEAVAFTCPQPAKPGDTATLKIGIGPNRQAVRLIVVRCDPAGDTHMIAAKFAGGADVDDTSAR